MCVLLLLGTSRSIGEKQTWDESLHLTKLLTYHIDYSAIAYISIHHFFLLASTMFQFNEYNCIGFDLDNTILQYNVPNMSELIYECISTFLVDRKGYAPAILKKSFESGKTLLQKGLALDLHKGNIVKLGEGGIVLQATHGTVMMTEKEICDTYGASNIWDSAKKFCDDPFEAWNGPLGQQIRCVLDNFDIPTILVYARAVDTIDALQKEDNDYTKIWGDILDGLNYNYEFKNFTNNTGDFFPKLRANPGYFIEKCPDSIIEWLQKLKKNGKQIFLITGSACDYATFTSTTAIGPAWKDLFDFIVFYARKPAFFKEERPFYSLDNLMENSKCQLTINDSEASQGNWKELHKLLEEKAGKRLKTIYVGDNTLQDVLAPSHFQCCDSLAVCGEFTDADKDTKDSVWGSYFLDNNGRCTFWKSILDKIAVHHVDTLASLVN